MDFRVPKWCEWWLWLWHFDFRLPNWFGDVWCQWSSRKTLRGLAWFCGGWSRPVVGRLGQVRIFTGQAVTNRSPEKGSVEATQSLNPTKCLGVLIGWSMAEALSGWWFIKYVDSGLPQFAILNSYVTCVVPGPNQEGRRLILHTHYQVLSMLCHCQRFKNMRFLYVPVVLADAGWCQWGVFGYMFRVFSTLESFPPAWVDGGTIYPARGLLKSGVSGSQAAVGRSPRLVIAVSL